MKKLNEYLGMLDFSYKINNDYSLIASKYIEFDNEIEAIDYDSEMKKIQSELKSILKEEENSRNDLVKVMEELGYGI